MGFEHMHVHDIPLATLSLMTTRAISHFNNYSRNQKHMPSFIRFQEQRQYVQNEGAYKDWVA